MIYSKRSSHNLELLYLQPTPTKHPFHSLHHQGCDSFLVDLLDILGIEAMLRNVGYHSACDESADSFCGLVLCCNFFDVGLLLIENEYFMYVHTYRLIIMLQLMNINTKSLIWELSVLGILLAAPILFAIRY